MILNKKICHACRKKVMIEDAGYNGIQDIESQFEECFEKAWAGCNGLPGKIFGCVGKPSEGWLPNNKIPDDCKYYLEQSLSVGQRND